MCDGNEHATYKRIFKESKNSAISDRFIIIKILLRFSIISNIIMKWCIINLLNFADHWSYNIY